MAQKSLPILNKVNTSMVWYTTFYYKYYKWLSSQNLYLLYFLNRVFTYLDFFFSKLLWTKLYNTDLYLSYPPKSRIRRIRSRYFKPVTSYMIALQRTSLVINLYYKTTLSNFQSMTEDNSEIEEIQLPIFDQDHTAHTVFFRD